MHLTYTPEFVRWLAAFIERAIQKYPADDAFRKKLEKTHATMKSPSRATLRDAAEEIGPYERAFLL